MKSVMHVCFVVNKEFILPLYVAIKSIRTSVSTRDIKIFVISIDLDEAQKRNLDVIATVGDNSIVWLDSECSCPLMTKLMLPSILPTSLSKILYLDADILVLNDIGQVWDIAESTGSIAAVVDYGNPLPDQTYFNAGVMLMNLTYMRENQFTKQMLQEVEMLPNGLNSLSLKEQDLYNKFFPNWQRLPLHFNVQGLGSYANYRTYADGNHNHPKLFSKSELNDLEENACIVHFTGASKLSLSSFHEQVAVPLKPWTGICTHPYSKRWLHILHSIPIYSSWTPPSIISSSTHDMLVKEIDEKVATVQASFIKCEQSVSAYSLSPPTDGRDTLAVLLPLTSRGCSNLCTQLHELSVLVQSLPDDCKIFVALDDNDPHYSVTSPALLNALQSRLHSIDVFPPTSPVHICGMVNELARRAYEEGYFYFLLLGDDITLHTAQADLMRWIRHSFASIALKTGAIYGFGCVCWDDKTSPGFPTFPIVSRIHLDIFHGQWCPTVFINQDADPYFHAIYRNYHAVLFCTQLSLSNGIGGAGEITPATRYERHHVDWKNELLTTGIDEIENYMQWRYQLTLPTCIRLDVIVPSYRIQRAFLDGIITLPVPPNCSTTFIIILDYPSDESNALRAEYEAIYGERVRIRVNDVNRGASYTRSRGIEESTADWLLFLDDDVIPNRDLLFVYVQEIVRTGAEYAGYVGVTEMPPPSNLYTKGISLIHLLHFWADHVKQADHDCAPWGITAQVVLRRTKERFNEVFPKTGGGEDIDLCLRTCKKLYPRPLKNLPQAKCTHPWWNDGKPFIARFYGWATGDSLLLDLYPQHTYRSFCNGCELSLVLSIGYILFLFSLWLFPNSLWKQGISSVFLVALCCSWILSVVVAVAVDICFAMYHILRETKYHLPHVKGWERVIAGLIGTVRYRIAGADIGHLCAPLARGKWSHIGLRYDWWCGLYPDEVANSYEREGICFVLMCIGIVMVHAVVF